MALAAACLLWQPLRAQSPSVPPEWEVRDALAALVEKTGKLDPLLDAVKPEDWVPKGAPQAYVAQWKSVKEETSHAIRSARELEKEPERLTLALETYFRLQSVDQMLVSLGEGIAKYQNPALADLIRGAMAETGSGRERLRQYIVQLAALREEQLVIADQEAQRCRIQMLQQGPPRGQGSRP
jgi:hypothetical protein